MEEILGEVRVRGGEHSELSQTLTAAASPRTFYRQLTLRSTIPLNTIKRHLCST